MGIQFSFDQTKNLAVGVAKFSAMVDNNQYADTSSKTKFVVLEYAMVTEGKELRERREGHVVRKYSYGNRVKLMASITRSIDNNIVVYKIKGFADQTDKQTTVDTSRLKDMSLRKFEADWVRLWVPSLPKTKQTTPNMDLIRDLDVAFQVHPTIQEAEQEEFPVRRWSSMSDFTALKECLKTEIKKSHTALAQTVNSAITQSNKKMNRRINQLEHNLRMEMLSHRSDALQQVPKPIIANAHNLHLEPGSTFRVKANSRTRRNKV